MPWITSMLVENIVLKGVTLTKVLGESCPDMNLSLVSSCFSLTTAISAPLSAPELSLQLCVCLKIFRGMWWYLNSFDCLKAEIYFLCIFFLFFDIGHGVWASVSLWPNFFLTCFMFHVNNYELSQRISQTRLLNQRQKQAIKKWSRVT